MHTTAKLLRLHRAAITASVDLVNTIEPEDLNRATPCAGWDLADLLAHMTVQHRGFAAAARGRGGDAAIWDPSTVADIVRADPSGAYGAAAADVLEAFAADGVTARSFVIPEFGPGVEVPGVEAIGFHFVDYVVHGWDVAAALGVPFDVAGEVVEAVLPIALAVPDGDFRASDGSPFARATVPPGAASDLDRVLSHLGRSPGGSPPAHKPERRR